MLYGDDFWYHDLPASRYLFERLEIIIDYIKTAYSEFDVRLATPSEYFTAVKQADPVLQYFTSDFFPYMNYNGKRPRYWTGYYTTRPNLKDEIYNLQRLARATEISSTLILNEKLLSHNASITLHHDAVTGTCRDRVAIDYLMRIKIETINYVKSIAKAIQTAFKSQANGFFISTPYQVMILYNPLN